MLKWHANLCLRHQEHQKSTDVYGFALRLEVEITKKRAQSTATSKELNTSRNYVLYRVAGKPKERVDIPSFDRVTGSRIKHSSLQLLLSLG